MTIDEAIRILNSAGDVDRPYLPQEQSEAIKLGSEALRQIKQIRVYAKELYLPLLPGETKE